MKMIAGMMVDQCLRLISPAVSPQQARELRKPASFSAKPLLSAGQGRESEEERQTLSILETGFRALRAVGGAGVDHLLQHRQTLRVPPQKKADNTSVCLSGMLVLVSDTAAAQTLVGLLQNNESELLNHGWIDTGPIMPPEVTRGGRAETPPKTVMARPRRCDNIAVCRMDFWLQNETARIPSDIFNSRPLSPIICPGRDGEPRAPGVVLTTPLSPPIFERHSEPWAAAAAAVAASTAVDAEMLRKRAVGNHVLVCCCRVNQHAARDVACSHGGSADCAKNRERRSPKKINCRPPSSFMLHAVFFFFM